MPLLPHAGQTVSLDVSFGEISFFEASFCVGSAEHAAAEDAAVEDTSGSAGLTASVDATVSDDTTESDAADECAIGSDDTVSGCPEFGGVCIVCF